MQRSQHRDQRAKVKDRCSRVLPDEAIVISCQGVRIHGHLKTKMADMARSLSLAYSTRMHVVKRKHIIITIKIIINHPYQNNCIQNCDEKEKHSSSNLVYKSVTSVLELPEELSVPSPLL